METSACTPLEQARPAQKRAVEHALNMLSYAVLAAGLATVVFCAWFVVACYSPVPFVDQWIFIQELTTRGGDYGLDQLWKQHNDHRIVIPKFCYLLDMRLFGGTSAFLLVLIYLIQVFHLGALAWLYRRIAHLSGAAWRTAVGITGLCLFSPKQGENFIHGGDLPLMIPCAAATVAFGAFVIYSQEREKPGWKGRVALAISIAAAAAGALSMANGLFLWGMLAIGALVLGVRRRTSVALAASTAIVGPIYLAGYHNPQHASQVSVSLFAQYILLYFGNSWAAISLSLGRALAVLAIAGSAILYLRFLLRRERNGFAIFTACMTVFVLGTATVTAIGRLGLGVEQAYASRYQTAALLFWCVLAVYLIWRISKANKPEWLLGMQIAAALVFLLIIPTIRKLREDAAVESDQMREASIALLAGVSDTAAIRKVIVPPYRESDVLLWAEFLRLRGLSIYAEPGDRSLGREFRRFYRAVPPSECFGSVDAVTPVRDPKWAGFRFSGWAFDKSGRAASPKVILAGPDSRVIGVATNGFMRPDVKAAIPEVNTLNTGFLGYIPGDLQQPEAKAFAVLSDGVSACPLGGGQALKLDVAQTKPVAGLVATGLSENLTRSKFPPTCNLDEVGGQNNVWGKKTLRVPSTADVRVFGWAVDQENRSLAAGVDVVIDGIPLAAEYGIERLDVERHFSFAGYRRSGFLCHIPVTKMDKGSHTVALRVISRDRKIFWETQSFGIVIE